MDAQAINSFLNLIDLLASTKYCLELAYLIVSKRIDVVHTNNSI